MHRSSLHCFPFVLKKCIYWNVYDVIYLMYLLFFKKNGINWHIYKPLEIHCFFLYLWNIKVIWNPSIDKFICFKEHLDNGLMVVEEGWSHWGYLEWRNYFSYLKELCYPRENILLFRGIFKPNWKEIE